MCDLLPMHSLSECARMSAAPSLPYPLPLDDYYFRDPRSPPERCASCNSDFTHLVFPSDRPCDIQRPSSPCEYILDKNKHPSSTSISSLTPSERLWWKLAAGVEEETQYGSSCGWCFNQNSCNYKYTYTRGTRQATPPPPAVAATVTQVQEAAAVSMFNDG